MQTPGGWPHAWTQAVGRELARYRREAGLSQGDLCARCATIGHPIARNTVVGLETGRREAINVHEVVVLAAALNITPAALLFPANTFVDLLPGKSLTSYEALEAFTGTTTPDATPGQVLDRLLPERDVQALVNLVNRIRVRHGG